MRTGRARLTLALTAASLLAVGGCGDMPRLILQGEVQGAATGAYAGAGVPAIHVRYSMVLRLDDGTERSYDYWTTTDERGEFYLEDVDSEEIGPRVLESTARVTLLQSPEADSDWSAAEPIAPPEHGGEGNPVVRYDRFRLAQPLVSVAAAVVVLKPDATSAPAASASKAREWLVGATQVWHQCGVLIQAVSQQEADASALGLPYSPATFADMRAVKNHFRDPAKMTVILTGPWNRDPGSELEGDNSWAYGSAPGVLSQGIIAEQRAADRPVLLAHEQGHFLNLLHVDDAATDGVDDTTEASVGADAESGTNLMFHHVIEENSRLTAGQCARVREALETVRSDNVLR